MIAYFRFALTAVLLAGIAALSAIVTMQFAVHRSIVAVPDLQGASVAEATSRAARLGLDLTVTERLYSTVLPAGRVLLQSPAASSQVRRGWNLAVAESLGPRSLAVPDVRGKNERDAILLIRQRGLELGAIGHLPDAAAPPGRVLAQDPGPDARGAAQPSVSLLVAAPQPAAPAAFVLPDERGQPYAEAAAALQKAGLQVTQTNGAPPGAKVVLNAATVRGTVIAQQPLAGSRVDAAAKIVLWVVGAPLH